MTKKLIVAACGLALSCMAAAQQSVEVLHWWTSGGGGPRRSTCSRATLEKQGVKWNDTCRSPAVVGEAAMTAVRARVTSCNLAHRRAAARLLTSRTGPSRVVLADLKPGRREGGLGQGRSGPRCQAFSKYNGKWIRRAVNCALDQLGLGQQVGARQVRRDRDADQFRRVHRRRREGPEGRLRRPRARRPTLARTRPCSTASC